MAVSYVGVTSGNSAGGTATSFATSLPAGWGQDDVAVLTGHVRGASLTMATPAGWTLVPGPAWPVAQGANSRAYVWHRVLQAGDTAPTITNSGAMTGGWSMTVYRGGDSSSPIGQVGTSVVSGTSLALPSLVGVLAGSALAVAVHAGVSTGTIPTNITPDVAYTEVADHATSRATTAANQRMEAAYRLIASAGSYGGESFTSDVTASMIAVLVEVTAPTSGATVAPGGLAVPVAVGSPAVDGTLTTAPDGVAVPVAVGSPAAAWSATAAPDGAAVPVALGAPGVSWPADAAPAGLPVPVAVGSPAAVWAAVVAPDGVAVPLAVGGPAVLGAPVGPDGLAVGVAVGDPTVAWAAVVAPDGITVPVAAGAPAVTAAGGQVVRPDTGPAVRPSLGVVVRPSAVSVSRPMAGVVVRPDAGVVVRP